MPLHDWSRVNAGIFHSFHLNWIAEINKSLNNGLLPQGYYSLAEQRAGLAIPDLLTLHCMPLQETSDPPPGGGIAVADAPPKVMRKQTVNEIARERRRSVTIRHASDHHLVAIIEIVSAANKDRPDSVDAFASKVAAVLEHGVHALVLDIVASGRHDPAGMAGAVMKMLNQEIDVDYPPEAKFSLASFAAASEIEVYFEHPQIGQPLSDMPLFLQSGRYINVPLDSTYQEAFQSLPAIYRETLEG